MRVYWDYDDRIASHRIAAVHGVTYANVWMYIKYDVIVDRTTVRIYIKIRLWHEAGFPLRT